MTRPDRGRRAADLARRVRARYESGGDGRDLTRLLALCRAAVAATAPGTNELPARLGALGGALRLRYAAHGDPADLDEAIRVFRDAAAATGTDPAAAANNLAVALSDRFDRTGAVADLDAAVDAAGRAVDATPPGHEDRALCAANLAVFRSDRYDLAGDLADLDAATDVAQDALDQAPPGDPALPRLHNLLSALALDRFERLGGAADLDVSVLAAEAAVAAAGTGSPELPGYLNNLGNALRLRFEVLLGSTDWGGTDDITLDVGDLRRSVAALRRSVELVAATSPDRPKFLTNLGNTLADLAIVLPAEADLGEAVDVLTDALAATDPGSPHRAGRLNNLATALRMRYDRDRAAADRDRAVAAFREICAESSAADPEATLAAAENWQRWAAARAAWPEVVEACDGGLRAARLLHRTQLQRDHQLAWMRSADGLATSAGLARSRLGDGRGAVAVLDGGRALLLADALRRDGADLAALGVHEPDLAARYEAAAEWETRAVTEPGIEAVRAARAELDGVIDEIREVEGFEDFLSPPTFDDVAATARDAAIVYLAAAEQGGLALVVRGGEVVHVPLDELTADALRDRAERHLAAYAAYRDDPAAGHRAWSQALEEVTAWLWTAAMGPALEALAGAPEAVLVAGGLLGLLPLHAAWTPDEGTPTGRTHALDRLTISYAPNARSLQAARDRAREITGSRLLQVVDPAPVPASALPAARAEALGFAAGAGVEPVVLPGGRATPRGFRRHAPGSEILHLACHGRADLDEPLESGLLLAGGRSVVLRDLMEMSLHVRLAVLSACETALPGTELPDEVIGLPTGLLQAGVAGVVASQWAVPDRATAMLMTEFARVWAGGRVRPAVALREAQQWLRDTTTADKREHWRADEALPAEVVDTFLDAVRYSEPDARDHADLTAWAAFTHLGA